MTVHAKLSASGSDRWMNCPGSIQAESQVTAPQSSSPAARQGTAAHAAAEFCLRENLAADEMLGWRIGVPLDEADHPDPVLVPSDSNVEISDAFDVFEVDHNMADAIQVFIDWVHAQLESLDDAELALERSYDLSWVYPNMFGTADATISEEFGTLVVGDYKHGQGVPVFIHKKDGRINSQIMYYAAGAAHDAGWTHERVKLAIIQPRCPEVPNIQEVEIDIEELKSWAETVLRKAAELTDDEDPILQAGDWCKWCKAASTCEEARSRALQAAGADFEGVIEELPVPTETDQLARAMDWLPMIDSWVKSVSGEVQRRLEAGQEVPGYKLVRKRSVRKFDPDLSQDELRKKVLAAARGEAKKADLFEEKLKPLGQLEKASPKLKAALVAGQGLTIKPEGGLTVAHESDKREAVSLLTNDFDGIED